MTASNFSHLYTEKRQMDVSSRRMRTYLRVIRLNKTRRVVKTKTKKNKNTIKAYGTAAYTAVEHGLHYIETHIPYSLQWIITLL